MIFSLTDQPTNLLNFDVEAPAGALKKNRKNEIFCLKGNSETIQDTKICENVSSCSELRVVKMEFSVSVDWRILTKRKGNSETLPDPEIGENVSSCPELRVIKIGHFC